MYHVLPIPWSPNSCDLICCKCWHKTVASCALGLSRANTVNPFQRRVFAQVSKYWRPHSRLIRVSQTVRGRKCSHIFTKPTCALTQTHTHLSHSHAQHKQYTHTLTIVSFEIWKSNKKRNWTGLLINDQRNLLTCHRMNSPCWRN